MLSIFLALLHLIDRFFRLTIRSSEAMGAGVRCAKA